MEKDYNLNCEFDFKKHKENFIDYLEVIIDKKGKIYYAVPSHTEKAISLLGMTRKEFEQTKLKTFYVLEEALNQSGTIAVWNNFYKGNANKLQKRSLYKLRAYGLYKGVV